MNHCITGFKNKVSSSKRIINNVTDKQMFTGYNNM